jgi:hypothetical protein
VRIFCEKLGGRSQIAPAMLAALRSGFLADISSANEIRWF